LCRKDGKRLSYYAISRTLRQGALAAGCAGPVTPHRLRHTYATSLLRAGVSILAIKELLGHRSLVMTMRYVQVTQIDLQREYHQARSKVDPVYSRAVITEPPKGISGINQTIAQASHQIEMYRRSLDNKKIRVAFQRLAQRLAKISAKLKSLDRTSK
jgi:hypothetical protein